MKTLLLCATFLCATGTLVFAADMQADQTVTRAVEAANGKVELLGGFEGKNGQAGQVGLDGGAAFSVPLGDKFGFQADFAANSSFGQGSFGTTGHLFTRNPNQYLLGLIGGGVWSNTSGSYYIGPEAEIYAGRFTLEGSAAVMSQNLFGSGTASFYGKGNVAYYATPNLRIELGAKDVAGYNTAHVGLEWQVKDASPLSLTLAGTVGDNSYLGAMAGLKFYFGSNGATLVDRHRKYDPANTSLDIVSGTGGPFNAAPVTQQVVKLPFKCSVQSQIGFVPTPC